MQPVDDATAGEEFPVVILLPLIGAIVAVQVLVWRSMRRMNRALDAWERELDRW